MFGRINKTPFVIEWWEDRLKSGRQLVGDYAGGVRPANTKWKKRISSELLWLEFQKWITTHHPHAAPQFTKLGFCTIFYRVASSNSAYVRAGAGVRYYAAVFMSLKEHRDAFEARRAGLEG